MFGKEKLENKALVRNASFTTNETELDDLDDLDDDIDCSDFDIESDESSNIPID